MPGVESLGFLGVAAILNQHVTDAQGDRHDQYAVLVEEIPRQIAGRIDDDTYPHVSSAASTSMAPPRPPPMQIVAMPRLAWLRRRTCNRCSTMRAAGSTDRVANRHRPAIDVQTIFRDFAQGPRQIELLAAIGIILPGRLASQHLRGEGFVQFPVIDVGQAQAVALQDGRRGMHRAEPHLLRLQASPFAVDDLADRLEAPLLHGLFRSRAAPRRRHR